MKREREKKKQFKETKQASNPDSAMVLMEKVHNMQKQLSNINGEMETLIEFKGNARIKREMEHPCDGFISRLVLTWGRKSVTWKIRECKLLKLKLNEQ